MKVLEASVPVQHILETFRNDQKVTALGECWPATQPEQEALLRRAHRPVDVILSLVWGLYELDRAEFLSLVRPVWVPPGRNLYCWTLGQMCAAHQAGTFPLPEPNTVGRLVPAMKAQFREADFVLIGYQDIPHMPDAIRLEDGHNRATAAVLAGVLPASIKMYLGRTNVAPTGQ